MSDSHGHDDHSAGDAHHDHGFDGEPAKELGPDEPLTPGWLPLLGGALFVALAVLGIVESNAGAESGAAPDGSAKPTTAQTVAQPVPSTNTNPRMLNAAQQPPPGASNQPTIRKLDPAQKDDLIKQLQDARRKLEAAGGH
jgi:hypothetical protein